MSKYIIYGLIDPRNLLIRYIGKSSSGLVRPKRHAQECKSTYASRWVNKLLRLGLSYDIVILDSGPQSVLGGLERWWIAFGKACGWPLTNATLGGEGTLGRPHKVETGAKIAEANRRRVWTEESRKRAAEASAKRSPEGVRKNVLAMQSAVKGKPKSPEQRAKLALNLQKARAARWAK